MKRIIIFSLAYVPYVGGAEIAIKEITDRLGADIEFHLVTLRMDKKSPREEVIGNVHVHRILGGKSRFAKFWFQFAAASVAAHLHRRHPFDGAWAMMAHSAGVPAVLFNYFHHVPYALTLQEGDPPEAIERTMRPLWPLFARSFRKASVVQAISNFLGDWARRRGFAGPLEIIPNGVNGKKFSTDSSIEEKQALRQKYRLAEDDCLMLTISRLVPKNGVDLVIRVLPALPPQVKFLIAGDGSERGSLEALAQELGVANRVIFAGHIDNADLPAYLHASNIFIRASRSEGQGIAFIEAMAAGVPVVAPQVGGITDFLFDEKKNPEHEPTGFAIEPESPESIVQVVQKIMNDPLRANQIANFAQKMVLRDYEWDLIAKEIKEKVFDKITK